jgi:hypothetical protein
MKFRRIAILSCAALAVILASEAWAGGSRGFGRSMSSGPAGSSGAGSTAGRSFSPGTRSFHHFHRFPSRTFFIGGFFAPYSFYYPPAYYYPPPVYYEPPPVYIEQQPLEQAPLEPGAQPYWYFCRGSGAYYPYVKECPGGWERVTPQPYVPSPTG